MLAGRGGQILMTIYRLHSNCLLNKQIADIKCYDGRDTRQFDNFVFSRCCC